MKIFNQIFSLYFVQKRKKIFCPKKNQNILSKKESKYFVQKRIKIFCPTKKEYFVIEFCRKKENIYPIKFMKIFNQIFSLYFAKKERIFCYKILSTKNQNILSKKREKFGNKIHENL